MLLENLNNSGRISTPIDWWASLPGTEMANGTPDDVENDVIRCMESAKENGGFILAPGDQMPVTTPHENIQALVDAGRKYGQYS